MRKLSWAPLRRAFAPIPLRAAPANPLGFFLMMPKADVIELAMSVDEALKYMISMGVVAPGSAVQPARN